MTNFSTNQVMHFYALDGLKEVTAAFKPYGLEKAGKIVFTKDGEQYASDKIENVMWATISTPEEMTPQIKTAKIQFAEGAAPIVGEDYIVRVSYPEVGGLGVEGWTTKTVVAHAGKGATAATVIAELNKRLNEVLTVDDVLVVGDEDGTDNVTISPNEDVRYERGIRPIAIADFKVSVNRVTDDGVEVDWALITVTATDAVKLTNGYKLADMEYFALGERGDEYRMVGYPDYIKSDYIVDPTKEYYVLNIHFAYKGANDQSHKSEKDLILAATTLTQLNTIAKALETEFDIKVKGYTAA